MDDKKNSLRKYLIIFFATVAIHWIVLYFAFVFSNNDYSVSNFFTSYNEAYIKCGDVPHYLNIAENGYVSEGEDVKDIVFYPLYPLLISILTFITKNAFVSGTIISNICLGFSACFLYRLTRKELNEEKALDGVVAYILYPFGIFLISVFTESLFIMLSLMCLFFTKEKKWGIAGICGFLATLSKSQGIALFVPMIYEIILDIKANHKFGFTYLSALLVPFGTGCYLLINKIVQGDYFSFIAHEEAAPWYNKANWISANLTQQYNMALDYEGLSLIIYWVQIFLFFACMLFLFYGLHKKISPSIIAYGGAYLFLSYMHGWLISGPRYVMSCVPLYIIYASIDNKYAKRAIMVACAVLMIGYTIASFKGYSIM